MEIRAIQCLIAALAFATTQVQADFRGQVHVLVNPDAPPQEWRRVPLAGAYVAIRWTIVIPAPAHAVDSCRYAELARADEQGHFVMEGPNPITAALAGTSFFAYAPGLEPINFPAPGSLLTAKDITMAKSTRAPDDRLMTMAFYSSPGCPNKTLGDPRGLRAAFVRSLLEEAKTMNVVDSRIAGYNISQIEAALRGPVVPTPEHLREVVVTPGGTKPIQADTPKPGTRP